MMRVVVAVLVMGLGAGCAQIQKETAKPMVVVADSGQIRPVARPVALKPAKRPPANARTVAQFDTTSREEKKAAEVEAKQAQQSGEGRLLGRTVASLGDPADPGLWIKTPLVDAPAQGRVIYPVNGKGVQLDLIPIDGPKTAGSRISLAALRVIGAPLAGLPEVEVYQQD
ncbi:hypothetical protein RXV86_16565 [Alisedimentitalea sp. MJ-SS2]|uniref:hypothetical protein n=1 Tax=Aliisedimentitalea sp. MJ-SS2 TaxID=3049795 RepID=UPI002906D6C4|nr:hypothetical protein [Alisedimentitalea sp. MJ-SS2]MDU8929009.1 hypothetical protein [Alisedimentitalea sp. MJ-SS2]